MNRIHKFCNNSTELLKYDDLTSKSDTSHANIQIYGLKLVCM